MTSHCAGTVQMREESESGIRKWEEMWFKTTAEDGEREGGSSDVWWKTVPQTSGCDRKRSVTDSGQTSTSNVQRRWWGRTWSLSGFSVYWSTLFVTRALLVPVPADDKLECFGGLYCWTAYGCLIQARARIHFWKSVFKRVYDFYKFFTR